MNVNITAMEETITPILMEIEYDPMDGADNLWGVIDLEHHYIKQYGANFIFPPKKKLYNNVIARDTTTYESRNAEAEHTAKRTNHALYDAAIKGYTQFIMDVVSETW